MSDYFFHDAFAAPADGDDPLGPFGTGPAVDDPEPWIDPVSEGFGADGAYGPINEPNYDDLLYEQFGDYDPWGPWADREHDYTLDLPDPDPQDEE